ncbi:MFS general substrate transporter [Tothia fuscella]|uniref:MFS general substrate transporter n=1 Tax=Tothia fuscella TaxID=1048955 RepID=A0A9P4P4N1_9PEZI|nr:MFS general substrate transporter [Tothia fuscella]
MPSKESVPFPTKQLFVLALCRICEPIAFMSIFPYIYFMIKSFHITDDERHIAVYAGMVTSAFAFAEFSASVFWGRLSDKVGRKPILLTGMAGTGISMLAFGFAHNLPLALVARALGGLLNGNIGVLQTTVAEVVTVKAHQPRAFSVMPFVWCLGSIVGAGLGGILAEPVKNYPGYFQATSIFSRFPYLLPNIVCATVVIFGLIIGFLFLEETHEDKKDSRDRGIEIGKWIVRHLTWQKQTEPYSKVGYFEETLALIAEREKIEPDPMVASPLLAPSTCSTCSTVVESDDEAEKSVGIGKITLRQAFTRQVSLIIVSYGILAFHTIALEQLMPILLSSAESTEAPHLPFKFKGGFALPLKTIGIIFSAQGFLQMISTIFIFPVVTRRLGSLTTFRIVIFGYPVLYFLIPYLALAPKDLRYPCIFLVLVWKVVAQSCSFPSQAIMMANSAPKRVLGTLNGCSASAASLARAFGPTVAGLVHVAGLNIGYSGLSWWSCAAVAILGAVVSLFMTETRSGTEPSLVSHDSCDVEALFTEPLLDSRSSTDADSSESSGTRDTSFDNADWFRESKR